MPNDHHSFKRLLSSAREHDQAVADATQDRLDAYFKVEAFLLGSMVVITGSANGHMVDGRNVPTSRMFIDQPGKVMAVSYRPGPRDPYNVLRVRMSDGSVWCFPVDKIDITKVDSPINIVA
jgi:hypothetical protein